jgi:hypothetical protein
VLPGRIGTIKLAAVHSVEGLRGAAIVTRAGGVRLEVASGRSLEAMLTRHAPVPADQGTSDGWQ